MRLFDTIIVGSGAAGISAALELDRPGTAILDVGYVAPHSFGWNNLIEAKHSGEVAKMLGDQWEMLANIAGPRVHAKLKAPLVRYVESGEPFAVTDASGAIANRGRGSYARGGFANAWGAQLYRYTQNDLNALGDWPITESDLASYYENLESIIGISGDCDDLSDYFGPTQNLLPSTTLVPSASCILAGYHKRKAIVKSLGLTIGRPRLAVLTRPYRGRPAYNFGETEFFDTMSPGVYTPQQTLDELLVRGNIAYLSGLRLDRYTETADIVELEAFDINTGERVSLAARRVLLACGALHTARLVLLNNKVEKQPLPVLDHPPALAPIFLPSRIGRLLPTQSFPTQLAGCFECNGERQMVSVYYAGGMLRSDLLADLPFALSDNLWLLNHLLSGLLVLQVWRPATPHPSNRLVLDGAGAIRLIYPHRPDNPGIPSLLRAFRPLGAFGHPRFAKESPVGWGFHFAGSLPMRRDPGKFETDIFGRLWNCRRVHVIDGAVLPSLPAKNLTFTIMANAARIAAHLARC